MAMIVNYEILSEALMTEDVALHILSRKTYTFNDMGNIIEEKKMGRCRRRFVLEQQAQENRAAAARAIANCLCYLSSAGFKGILNRWISPDSEDDAFQVASEIRDYILQF